MTSIRPKSLDGSRMRRQFPVSKAAISAPPPAATDCINMSSFVPKCNKVGMIVCLAEPPPVCLTGFGLFCYHFDVYSVRHGDGDGEPLLPRFPGRPRSVRVCRGGMKK